MSTNGHSPGGFSQTETWLRLSLVKGVAVPAGPPLSEAQSGEPRHEVQLGRPHVAVRRGERLEPAVDHPVVMRHRDLRRDVVLLVAEVSGRRREDVRRLARRETPELGDVVLDDEAAAGLQVRGGVAEGLDLFVLGGQVRDRVAQQVDERERSARPGGREVADGDVDVGAARLRAEFRHHGGRSSIPCTVTSRRCSGKAMRPVPMPNSRAGPAAASSARKSTAGSTTAASNSSGHRASYRAAIQASKWVSGMPSNVMTVQLTRRFRSPTLNHAHGEDPWN